MLTNVCFEILRLLSCIDAWRFIIEYGGDLWGKYNRIDVVTTGTGSLSKTRCESTFNPFTISLHWSAIIRSTVHVLPPTTDAGDPASGRGSNGVRVRISYYRHGVLGALINVILLHCPWLSAWKYNPLLQCDMRDLSHR